MTCYEQIVKNDDGIYTAIVFIYDQQNWQTYDTKNFTNRLIALAWALGTCKRLSLRKKEVNRS